MLCVEVRDEGREEALGACIGVDLAEGPRRHDPQTADDGGAESWPGLAPLRIAHCVSRDGSRASRAISAGPRRSSTAAANLHTESPPVAVV
jgi:hypothetical protein